VNYYMIEPSYRQRKTPHDKQKINCLDHNQNLAMSPEEAQRQDGLND